MGNRFGQLDYLDGPGTIRQATNKAAFLEGGDEPMNSRFRPQIEGVLHLVEGRRHTGFGQPLVDEAQELELLAGQHLFLPVSTGPERRPGPKQIMNEHYLFHMCSATI